jgi:hypothetical protein
MDAAPQSQRNAGFQSDRIRFGCKILLSTALNDAKTFPPAMTI